MNFPACANHSSSLAGHASRRDFLRLASAATLSAALARFAPAWAQSPHAGHGAHGATTTPAPAANPSGQAKVVDLTIERIDVPIGDRVGRVVAVNRSLPAPLLRFREGDEVELRVTNRLDESASIHWHGLLLPAEMDGVPGVSFKGIDPGETFVYRFPLKQYGTYWYHSHSGMHEQLGQYGPIVIDPAHGEHAAYARDYVVVLSDWTFTDPHRLFAKLKKRANFSNLQRRTAVDFFADVRRKGLGKTWEDWGAWSKMRMDPTDIADLTGSNFTFLMNGRTAANPWTGIFQRGERVRLRFINAAATTHYDVRIPGLKLTVIEADGQHVRPIEVEEFRMGAAETYDVLVEPNEDRAYTIFAETSDRSGYALGTLAPREGMRGPIPERRERPLRTMADMGMGEHDMSASGGKSSPASGMEHSTHGSGHGGHGAAAPAEQAGHANHSVPSAPPPAPAKPAGAHGGHEGHSAAASTNLGGAHAGHGASAPPPATAQHAAHAPAPATQSAQHAGHGDMKMPENIFGPSNAMMAMNPVSRAHEPGLGLGENGSPSTVCDFLPLTGLPPQIRFRPRRNIHALRCT